VNIITLIILSFFSALVNYPFNTERMPTHTYLYEDPTGKESAFQYSFRAFWSFYLILNALIPLELVVCLEIGKFICTFYMMDDAFMAEADYEQGQVRKLKCQTMNLHEDLGLVEYIFTDKTGTLTKNELVFKALSVANSTYDASYERNAKIVYDLQDCKSDENFVNLFRCINICHSCMMVEINKE